MENKYVKEIVKHLVKFCVPKKAKNLIVTADNRGSVFTNNKNLFEYIVFLNVLEKEKDILLLLDETYKHLLPGGRLIIVYRNYLQSFLYEFLSVFFNKNLDNYNWLSTFDIKTFLQLGNFDIIVQQPLCLFSHNIPIISSFLNKFLLFFFPFNHLSFLHYITARKVDNVIKDYSVSIIIPARNEEGNIEPLLKRLPPVGTSTEVIFIEGHSKDKTKEEIKRCIKKYSQLLPFNFKLISQKGVGKADAVRLGFSKATRDILVIYDADMSVSPNDLTKFYFALISQKGEFINGSRLVYPMQKNAMQFLNIFGNKIFSLIYSWLLGQVIKDTLCGTKILWRKDYLKIEKDKTFFGKYDPFGDFDLLLGASRLNLKIIDLPIRYQERTYGSTNIKRFTNAYELAKFSYIAIKKLKIRIN